MTMEPISEFSGKYRFLSNFWPVVVGFEGNWYPSVEHAYQAAKFDDPIWRVLLRDTAEPGRAKHIANKYPARAGFFEQRLAIMEHLLRQKFQPGSELARLLLDTKDALLEEGNRWGDRYWGKCLRTGQGENQLGLLLMKIRLDLETK